MTDINKRFAELAGICWHELSISIPDVICSCGKRWESGGNISEFEAHQRMNTDFSSDPLAVLRVMREKLDDPDWVRFVDHIGEAINWPKDGPSVRDMVRIDLLLTPGAMVKAAVDYLTNVQRNDGKS